MDQNIINLYDRFTHGGMSRREFLDRLSGLVGSAAAAAALVPLLQSNYAQAAIVAPDDARLAIVTTSYDAGGVKINGYLARLKDGRKRPAVVVIHENRGLNAHIEDVTRRIAVAGFLGLAPDLLSPAGGTPANEDQARDMIGKLDMAATVANAVAAVAFLRGHADGNGKVGAVGFCWGGGLVNQLAVNDPTLNAAVAYYGRQPDAADVPKIKAPLLLHYAGLDTRIDEGIPAYKAALDKAGASYQIFTYEGANHAFNNDTSAERYNAEAAKLAWDRTLAFFTQKLKASA
jgi:carboxymethylenebutenolidase